jgi:uncharacterized protein YoxC
MADFEAYRNNSVMGSLFGAGIGALLLFTPIKPLSTWVVAGSLGFLACSQLAINDAEKQLKAETQNKELAAKNLEGKLNESNKLVNQFTDDLERKSQEIETLSTTIKSYEANSKQLNQQIERLSQEIRIKNDKISQINDVNSEVAIDYLQQSFDKFRPQIEGLINVHLNKIPELKDKWESINKDFKNEFDTLSKSIRVVSDIKTSKEFIECAIGIQHEIIKTASNLIRRILLAKIEWLKRQLKDSITITEHNQQINQIKQQYQHHLESIRQEFHAEYDEISNAYTTEFSEIVQEGMSQTELIEALQHKINSLEAKLKQLSLPMLFPSSHEQATVGNAIIGYFAKLGIRLDALDWLTTDTGYKLLFYVGFNGNRSITPEMMNDNDTPFKLKELSGAINNPKFEYNHHGGHMVLEIQKRHAVKTKVQQSDIDKIWVPASKFEKYVSKWERVRITAGSTGGKSPTAKNLALAILNARQGKGEIRLYDPQHGSKKDYWDMPKKGFSHEDNLEGMRSLCKTIDERRNGRNFPFVLYIFDELDNTIASLKGNDFKNLVKYSLKEGSHADIGVIYIGQSADANEVPGMTHSNWNNAVQLHIGSNAGIAIEKLKTVTIEDKNRLLEQYKLIQEYCENKNNELGLDIFTDATAYRFGLVIPLTGLPKFIQLPDFDSYNYYSVLSENTEKTVNVDSVDNHQTASTASAQTLVEASVDINVDLHRRVSCPSCGSINSVKNGKTKSTQKLKCKDCGHNYSVAL